LQQSNDTWKSKLLSQDAELARLHAQLDVLEQAERAFSGYAGGVQSLLKAAGEGTLKGVRGVFGSLLEVPVEYETAIAAALSEYLDGLVIDGHDQIEAGIAILELESVRGVFLPMIESTPDGLLSGVKAGEEVLGVAAELVKAPADLQALARALLGRTLVVKDRSAARRVLREYHSPPGGGLRAVTLHGEVFHSSGPVTAGRLASHAALARPRERKTLQNGIQDGEARLAGLKEAQAKIEAELRDLQGEETRLEQALVSAQAAERAAQSLYSQRESTFRSMDGKLQWTQERLSRIQAESQIAEREAAEIHKSLSQLDPLISQAREDVRSQESSFIGIDLDDYQSQAGYWSTQVAVAERALADSQSRLAERKAALEQAGRSIDAAQARLKDIDEALQNLGADKAGKRKLEADVTAQIEALDLQIEPAEIDLAKMEQQQDEVQIKEAAARQELSKAEHNHAQAKINHARRQEALETWRRRIEDDFGLVAFEYTAEVSGPTPLPLEGFVEQLPHIRQISPELEETMRRLQAHLRRMGAINPEAQNEYHEVKQRFEFMTEQVADLKQAEEDVRQVIAELDDLMQRELRRTFDAVAEEFSGLFHRLFGGGSARLLLTDPEDMNATGIDIEARLPGKRMQGLSLLSGGERSLTATALIFALLKVSPTPFCLLDEVDAMLDETNVGRFRDLVRELSQYTQFIMVTHNRSTVQVADVIYGVTMGRDSTSQVISLKIDDVEKVIE
jgi:chromosome segregation protein